MTDLRKYEMSKQETILLYIVVCAVGLAISYLMYRQILFAVIAIPLIPWSSRVFCDYMADRRRRRYLIEFKDFLFLASTSIGAGRSMKDAIYEAIPILRSIHGEASVLAGVLAKAYERISCGGENDVAVLSDMANASGLEDVYDFVTIYSICKATGASLIIAMNKASSVIIDKMTIEREIEEMTRRKKNEGMVIFIMPILIILFLNVFAPDYISPLYETLAGRVIMTAVIASAAGIYVMIQKITKVEI